MACDVCRVFSNSSDIQARIDELKFSFHGTHLLQQGSNAGPKSRRMHSQACAWSKLLLHAKRIGVAYTHPWAQRICWFSYSLMSYFKACVQNCKSQNCSLHILLAYRKFTAPPACDKDWSIEFLKSSGPSRLDDSPQVMWNYFLIGIKSFSCPNEEYFTCLFSKTPCCLQRLVV